MPLRHQTTREVLTSLLKRLTEGINQTALYRRHKESSRVALCPLMPNNLTQICLFWVLLILCVRRHFEMCTYKSNASGISLRRCTGQP